MQHLFHEDLLRSVLACMMEHGDDLLNKLTESAFTGLVIRIVIAVNRILKGTKHEKIQLQNTDAHERPTADCFPLSTR